MGYRKVEDVRMMVCITRWEACEAMENTGWSDGESEKRRMSSRCWRGCGTRGRGLLQKAMEGGVDLRIGTKWRRGGCVGWSNGGDAVTA